jgi:hypothetical protein
MWPINTTKAMATKTKTNDSEIIRTAVFISRFARLAASASLSGDTIAPF